ATVLEGYSNTNFGSTSDMWAGYDEYLSPYGRTARSLIQFDVSTIPFGTTISNASLRVFLVYSWDFPSTSRTITTYRPNSTWSESIVTWNNHPSPVESYGSASVTHLSWGWYSFDVTNLVQGWVNNSIPNYGIMLRGSEQSGYDSSVRGFSTREGDYTPELVVTYSGSTLLPGTGPGGENSLDREHAIPIIEAMTGESTNWANSCQGFLQQQVTIKCLSYR
ncbi:unnamed protein product, partial [marine sediment metagenome]